MTACLNPGAVELLVCALRKDDLPRRNVNAVCALGNGGNRVKLHMTFTVSSNQEAVNGGKGYP